MHCKKTFKVVFLCVRVLNHAEVESTWIKYRITTLYSVPASLLLGRFLFIWKHPGKTWWWC